MGPEVSTVPPRSSRAWLKIGVISSTWWVTKTSALLPLAGSRYSVDLATQVLIHCLFALSLNVLIGYTGNISFGHAAYFAIGGYACAVLLTTYHWPLLLALPAAIVISGLAAAVIGYFCVRLTQIYFAMLTLAFAMQCRLYRLDSRVCILVPELLTQVGLCVRFGLIIRRRQSRYLLEDIWRMSCRCLGIACNVCQTSPRRQ